MNQTPPPSADDLAYVKAGPDEFSGHRQAYRDGALFVAAHGDLPVDFWNRHPRVKRAEPEPGEDQASTRIWPTSYERAADYPSLPASLERAPDAVLDGWLDPGVDFWSVHPDVVAVEYMASIGGDGPDAWQAKLWLNQA